MVITITEFRRHFGKYLDLSKMEDIIITNRGRAVGMLVSPNKSSVERLSGLLAGKVCPTIDRKSLREERLSLKA